MDREEQVAIEEIRILQEILAAVLYLIRGWPLKDKEDFLARPARENCATFLPDLIISWCPNLKAKPEAEQVIWVERLEAMDIPLREKLIGILIANPSLRARPAVVSALKFLKSFCGVQIDEAGKISVSSPKDDHDDEQIKAFMRKTSFTQK